MKKHVLLIVLLSLSLALVGCRRTSPLYRELISKIKEFDALPNPDGLLQIHYDIHSQITDSSNQTLVNISMPGVINVDTVHPYMEMTSGYVTSIVSCVGNDILFYHFDHTYMVKQTLSQDEMFDLITAYDLGLTYEDYSGFPVDAEYVATETGYTFSMPLLNSSWNYSEEVIKSLKEIELTNEELESILLIGSIDFDFEEKKMKASFSAEQIPIPETNNKMSITCDLEFDLTRTFTRKNVNENNYLMIAPSSIDYAHQFYPINESFTEYIVAQTGGYFLVNLDRGGYAVHTSNFGANNTLVYKLFNKDGEEIIIRNNCLYIENRGLYIVQVLPKMNHEVTISIDRSNYSTIGNYNKPIAMSNTIQGLNEGREDYQYYQLNLNSDSMVKVEVSYQGTGSLTLNVYSKNQSLAIGSEERIAYYYECAEDEYIIEVGGDYVGNYELRVSSQTNNGETDDLLKMHLITSEYDALFYDGNSFVGPSGYIVITSAGNYVLDARVMNREGYQPLCSLSTANGTEIIHDWYYSTYLQPGTYVASFRSGYPLSVFQAKIRKLD